MSSSTNPKTIVLKGEPIRKEGTAGGAITPGHLVDLSSGTDLIVHATAGGNAAPAFADVSDFLGKTIDTAYAAADGTVPADTVLYFVGRPGDEVYAWLAAGQTAVRGSFLESAANGALRVHTAVDSDVPVKAIVARAIEAVDNAAGIVPVRIRVEVI